MAKFVYSMQNVLDVKYKLEEQAKTEYNLAQIKVNEAQDELARMQEKRQGYEEEKVKAMQGILDRVKMEEMTYAVDTMEYYIMGQKDLLNKCQKELNSAREKLQEMMVDRKTHEKLKENEFEEFKLELNATEKKEIDELVSYQYNQPQNKED